MVNRQIVAIGIVFFFSYCGNQLLQSTIQSGNL